MKRFLVYTLLAVTFAAVSIVYVNAQSRQLLWDAPTHYTNDTPIESGNTLSYDAWMQDNVTKVITKIANKTAATSASFDDALLVKGRTYNFWIQAHLLVGESSDNSAVTSWTCPLGKSSRPVNLRVAP